MAEASAEIQQVLRESMAKLVQHMADRLKEGPDGKPLRFKESTVSNLVEFLANLSSATSRMIASCREWLRKRVGFYREWALTNCGPLAICARQSSKAWRLWPRNWTR